MSKDIIDKYRVWVKNTIRDKTKKENLLKEKLLEDDVNSLKSRSLNDTKYISRFLQNYINDGLEFSANKTGKKKQVWAVNGATTAYMRKRWGISKIRENGDVHHCIDALVVALISDGMIQKVSQFAKHNEEKYLTDEEEIYSIDYKTGEMKNEFPRPWANFRNELFMRTSKNPMEILKREGFSQYSSDFEIKPIFVSKMQTHKISGLAHKETFRSPVGINEINKFVVTKKNLTDIKLNKDGEIENYYNPQDDTVLYNALTQRLKQFNNDAKNAFRAC